MDLESYNKNRELLYSSLKAYGYDCVKPEGAFYLFVKALEPGRRLPLPRRPKSTTFSLCPAPPLPAPATAGLPTVWTTRPLKTPCPASRLWQRSTASAPRRSKGETVYRPAPKCTGRGVLQSMKQHANPLGTCRNTAVLGCCIARRASKWRCETRCRGARLRKFAGCCTMCSSPFFCCLCPAFQQDSPFRRYREGRKNGRSRLYMLLPPVASRIWIRVDRRGLSGNPRWCCKTAPALRAPQQGSTPGIGNMSRLCRLLF